MRTALAAACVALGLLVALELGAGAPFAPPPRLQARAAPVSGAASAAAGGPLPPLERYAQVVERPLFEPTRRAPQPPRPAGTAQSVAAAEDPIESLRLAGILRDARRRVVLIQQGEAGTPLVLRPGDAIEGWTLAEVGTESVLLRRGEEARRLALQPR